MDVFSSLMAIGECLLDSPRTQAFERAIASVVQRGDTVLDAGTGSGILALFSARAGARRVIAVDIAEELVRFARQNVATNRYDSVIDVRHADANSLALSGSVDVVTMELLDTWLVAEQQVAVLNELHANRTIGPHTRLIPCRYQCILQLVNYDFSFYGFRMPFVIQARNYTARDHVQHRLSAAHVVRDLSFYESHELDVHTSIRIPVEQSGTCTAAVLTARTFLTEDAWINSTSDMNMPVIVPLEKRTLARGETVCLDIAYAMGSGFGSFRVDWAVDKVTQPRESAAADYARP
jgi:predicted RNA methylase